MVRRAPDGRMSLYDLVAEWTHAKPSNAYTMLQRLMRKGIVHCNYDRVTLGGGMPTPIVTDQEWISIRSHLPSQTYMASRRKADDLYVMQYSTRDDVVKIGRSRNIEQRRRHLQDGHNFLLRWLLPSRHLVVWNAWSIISWPCFAALQALGENGSK